MNDHTISRRSFTKTITGAAAGLGCLAAARPGTADAQTKKKEVVAVQLYTVRDLTAKDFTGTVKEVARIGYDAVEFAGYGGLAAKDMKKLLDDLGLGCAGTHEGFERLDKSLSEVIDYNKVIGNHWIGCPSMPRQFTEKGADGFKAFGEKMNAIGEKVAAAGMELYYHNHSFEFKKEGGKYLLDYLWEASNPKFVKAEIDVYWVKDGGEDPAAYIAKLKGRCPLLHMKDMTSGTPKTYAPVGTGILDMKVIVKAGRSAGVRCYVVEEDTTQIPPLESIAISCKNMRELLKG